ncbi:MULTISPECIES: homing endonuclease associated repeat-containing protein [Halobacterium]|uniref:homing endonuclease associated repeat-containing protein n=1 Tax=Halobacterium TaxID=2239 RepID=UPI000AF7119B|nr:MULTISPECIES: hypothetical protein [Halobacterium]MCG1004945.1 hypothetical protein [Halobacterium noricense]
MSSWSDEELLEDLRVLADALGHSPTATEYRELGGEHDSAYYERFGSWANALATAGLEPYFTSSSSREELRAELRRVAESLGETPSTSQMNEVGHYSVDTYYQHFESWPDAIAAAGLEERTPQKIPTEDLLAELQRLAREVEDPPPSTSQMDAEGEYSAWTYKNRFGSWSNALEQAGLEPREPRTPQPANKIPAEDLIAELRRVAAEIDDSRPSTGQVDTHGAYSAKRYRLRFGSWEAALEAAGLNSE